MPPLRHRPGPETPAARARSTCRPTPTGSATAIKCSRPPCRSGTGSGSRPDMRTRNRQSGVVLFIALIVLVALSLAGLATMRSVDTAALVASNIGFRQAAVHSADQGIQTAYNWLIAQVSGGV